MLRLESGGAALVCCDGNGKTRWQAALVVEDEKRAREVRFSSSGAGRAGPWHLRVKLGRTTHGLDRVSLSLLPLEGKVVRRVGLRLTSGADGLPRLDGPRTRVLTLRQGAVGQDGVTRLGRGESASSFLATVVRGGGRGPALLFGSGGPAEDFARFHLDSEHLFAGFEPNRELRRAEDYSLVFGAGEPLTILDLYGDYLSGFARPAPAPLTGWNSWDYYGGAITMDDVRQEMAAINASPLKGKLTHLALDMGWEQAWGEWTPNSRFPALTEMAGEIAAAGFVPGIWVAPLQAHVYSRLGRHRQDLMARGDDGWPVLVDRNTALDFTLDEVQALLADLFGSLRQAGFRLFKIDYIYQAYLDQIHGYRDAARGKAGFVRAGLEAIRDAIGEDAHLLNCGSPVESALGLADSARVTVDIHTFWGHIEANARQLASRLWQNGRLWTIDPDFAIVRGQGTTRDAQVNPLYRRRPLVKGEGYWMAGPEATADELRVWLTQVCLSSGNTFVSDSIARLNRRGVSQLGKILPPLHGTSRALDLFESPTPRFWLATGGRRSYLGVFNWEDDSREIDIPTGLDLPESGRDVWTGEAVKVGPGTPMARRSAYLLRI